MGQEHKSVIEVSVYCSVFKCNVTVYYKEYSGDCRLKTK